MVVLLRVAALADQLIRSASAWRTSRRTVTGAAVAPNNPIAPSPGKWRISVISFDARVVAVPGLACEGGIAEFLVVVMRTAIPQFHDSLRDRAADGFAVLVADATGVIITVSPQWHGGSK